MPKIRPRNAQKSLRTMCLVGIPFFSRCEGESTPIRPDWQIEEHAVCPHFVKTIPPGAEMLDVSAYDGPDLNYWELRKIDDSTLQIGHSDSSSHFIILNLYPSPIKDAYLQESPNPNETFAWIETKHDIYLYRFERGMDTFVGRKVKSISDKPDKTHRLVWLENHPYVFSLSYSFREIRAPIHLIKLRPDLTVERSWNTSFCLIEFAEKCTDNDDNDDDDDSNFVGGDFVAVPSHVSPTSNTSHLSIGIEVTSSNLIDDDESLQHYPGHTASPAITRQKLQKNTRNSEARSNIYVLRYYNEPGGLKYRSVHTLSRDPVTINLDPDNPVEVANSPWATYVLAPNSEDPKQTKLAQIPNESNIPIYHANPFESTPHLIQRTNGPIVGSLSKGRFSYGRVKRNPVLGFLQLDSNHKNSNTFMTVGTGFVLIPGHDGHSELISLNCNNQPQAPTEP